MSDTSREIILPPKLDMPPDYVEGKLDEDLIDPRNPEAELKSAIEWDQLTEGMGDSGALLASSKLREAPKPFTIKEIAGYAVASLAGNLDTIEARREATLENIRKNGRGTRSHK